MITKLFSRVLGRKAIRTWAAPASRPGDVTLPVVNYKQLDDYSCAAVAGFSVVKTFHPGADFREFYDSIDPDPESGASDWRLVRSLRKFGIKCGWLDEIPSFKYIRACIDGKALILAGIHLGDDVHHWVTIYGYGINPGKSVFLASCSGFFRPNRVRWEDFRKAHVQSIGAIRCIPRCRRGKRMNQSLAYDRIHKTRPTALWRASGVQKIGYGAFSRCSKLTNLTLPVGVTSIDTFALFSCGITNLWIPETNRPPMEMYCELSCQRQMTSMAALRSLTDSMAVGCHASRLANISASRVLPQPGWP